MARGQVYLPPSGSQINQFAQKGFPGEYHSAITVAAGTTQSFTGSQFGYGAVMLGAGAAVSATKIHVAGGSTIDGDDLAVSTIYNISPSRVDANTGVVYVFKRQQ